MVVGGGAMLPSYDDVEANDQLQAEQELGKGKGAKGQQEENSLFIYLMTLLAALGGFLFGYDTGVVSGAMIFVRVLFQLNSVWQELVVSVTILGAWVMSMTAGSLSERCGRKRVIMWASVIFVIGSLAMGFATDKWTLLIGRTIVGMAIGLSSSVIPVYIAEVAPTKIRGSLVTLNTCFITFGQLSAAITAGLFSFDKVNGWRWMLGLAAVPALIQFLGFIFMPESPRWLIGQKRQDEALIALKTIRGKQASSSSRVMSEFERMRKNQAELVAQEGRRREQNRNIIVAIMRKTATRRALIVGCLLQAFQQLAGINTVMYYTATIIEMSGVKSQSLAVWLSVPTSAVYVVCTFCGYLVADRLGRRTLTLGSLMGVIISLILLGTGFQLSAYRESAQVTQVNMSAPEACFSKRDCQACIADPRCGFCYDMEHLSIASCLERNPDDEARSLGGACSGDPAYTPAPHHDELSRFSFATHACPHQDKGISLNTWLVVSGLILYLASFAPGMAGMPWTINSEIYPMWARGLCFSIATSVNWLFNLLISLTFISLTEVLTTHGAFYMYAVISSIGWLLIFWMLPETRGRSLDDISSLFAKSKQPDNQEIMDDGTSTMSQQQVSIVSQQQMVAKPVAGAKGAKRRSVGHDNIAFATGDLQMATGDRRKTSMDGGHQQQHPPPPPPPPPPSSDKQQH